MKAKVKATDRLIEVEKAMIGYAECEVVNINGFPMRNLYSEAELEFLYDAPEEVVIDGWVARDRGGSLYLHCSYPNRDATEWHSVYCYIKSLPPESFPSITWESEPKRVKITITLIEE